jgi:hypothetical protein
MIRLFLGMWLVALSTACSELSDYYTKDYRLAYARPIGLMMSPEFDALQLSGEGIKIGVIDAGFGNFLANEYTQALQIGACKDFIRNDTTGFFSQKESDHGTRVCKNIGGKNREGQTHGLAYKATFYLAKADIEEIEPREDEYRLIEAVEWLLSLDVRLINISLGYTTFDDHQEYTTDTLDGKTAYASRYIDSLLHQYPDLVVVASAGNQGNKPWRYLTFPADVEEVITVGSTDFDGAMPLPNSGVGVSYVPFIKPEVSTYPSPYGNSFTAPVMTGLVAALQQYRPLDRSTLRKLLT